MIVAYQCMIKNNEGLNWRHDNNSNKHNKKYVLNIQDACD